MGPHKWATARVHWGDKHLNAQGMLLHCVRTAYTYQETHPRSPTTCLIVAWQRSKAHKIIMKLPSNRSVQTFCA